MIRIAIIIGSTRPARVGQQVAHWVHDNAIEHGGAEFEVIDLAEVELPFLDEPQAPAVGNYAHPHTREWAGVVDGYDAFVFVTPEYNRSIPAALKNALDFVYAEWQNKAAGFVGYGANGGVRAVEHLRQVVANVSIADVRMHVLLSIFDDFVDMTEFKPAERHRDDLFLMLDELIAWGEALAGVRRAAAAA